VNRETYTQCGRPAIRNTDTQNHRLRRPDSRQPDDRLAYDDPVDLRRLRYFVAVAEEGHYGRAAARLHISTPPLSQRIQELENELGLVLLERTSRKVTLTSAGQEILDHARVVLAAVEELEANAARLSTPLTIIGRSLALGFCHGSESIVRTAARRFHERHPDIAIHPEALTSVRMFEDLQSGRLAIGIVRAPIPNPNRLASRLLCRVAFDHLAVPEGHPLSETPVINVADLEGQSMLLVSRNEAPTYHDATVAYLAEHGVRARWVEHSATQVERMLDMVSVGSGIGWLNRSQASNVHHEGVTVVPLRPITRFDEFHVAWRVDDQSSEVQQFIDIVVDVVDETEDLAQSTLSGAKEENTP
jgi:DNA-binding transcriptional LysR family regulator